MTAATVALAVLCHYEGLRWMSIRLPQLHSVRRRKVLLGVYGVVLLHVAEIWLFGAAIWLLLQVPDTGHISGAVAAPFLDAIYLSAETFSTVGFGDLAPAGPIRFICGTEALTGFILITWSASFLFLEMQQFWRAGAKPQ
ncbi:MAG: potassium channel family protein [Pseudomonadota bacterium]